MKDQPTPKSKGIYLLPNLFTTGALFAGYYSIIAGINGKFEIAAIAIFIAALLDGLDGRVARLTNTESAFGEQYDSLSDLISFGLAPSLLMYNWSLHSLVDIHPIMGKIGWLVAFIYAACAALRLARFNSQNGGAEKRYFKGLASPSAAALVAGFIWVGSDWVSVDVASEPSRFITVVGLVVTLFAALLMVSNVLFRSFKDFDMKGRVPFVALLIVVMVFVLISIDPPIVLFAGFLIYALSGPVGALMRRSSKRSQEPGGE
ncbi:MAG: CDP-diacylglycerol--serine O-phosphatidyltransferase [Proteobacteria bacterium]|nr:CDP-diacylglycerol--serine O-phosphatidyltransferase [Pseudomonadota bacterium]